MTNTRSPGRVEDAPDHSPVVTVSTGVDDGPDADLSAALDGLLRLAFGGHSLEHSLTWIATLAAQAISAADGAGLTMLEAGHSRTVCVSHPFVGEVDDIQYSLGEGPCITAAAQARTVTSGSLGSDAAWPRFGRRVRELGVNSVLSLPLIMSGGEVVGAMNVYAYDQDAFTARSGEQGQVFATAAAVAVFNARELMQARRLADQLGAALTSRAVSTRPSASC